MENNVSQNEKNSKIDKIFTKANLPPLFGENFSKVNISWKRLNNIAFEDLGRILICHLLIETHLNKLIELEMPKHFDIDYANLNFSQKIKLMRNHRIFEKVGFYQGIITINKIRNRFSHNIEATIEDSEIGIIVSILKKYSSDDVSDPFKEVNIETYSNLAIIELFVSLYCAYNSGFCSRVVMDK